MIAAQGVLTSRGGRTSHAAVVARGHGQDRGVRRRGARGRRPREEDHAAGRARGRRGRRALDRRHERRGLPRRGARRREPGHGLLRGVHGTRRERRPRRGGRPDHAPRRLPAAAARARQRRHRRGLRHRPDASAPRASGSAAPSTCSWASAGSWWRRSCSPRPATSARRPSRRCCRCRSRTSPRSTGRWRACR